MTTTTDGGTGMGPDIVTDTDMTVSTERTVSAESRRLIGLSLDDDQGRRPVFGDEPLFQGDPGWHDLLPFHEYFDGDTGKGLGASHQTGWTALVIDPLLRRPEGLL